MNLIQVSLYALIQLCKFDCAKLTGRKHVVFPELLESRGANSSRFLKITGDLALNLRKSSILDKSFLLRTYEDGVMKHTYHDGEILEEDLYHDVNYFASVMVSEDDGLRVEGVLGPTLRIKPLTEERIAKGRNAHLLYEIAADEDHNDTNMAVGGQRWAHISKRDDRPGKSDAVAHPELIVIADSTFRRQFTTVLTLLKYIIITVNSANVRYTTVQNPGVRLKLHALEVFDEYTESFLHRVDNILAAVRSLEAFKNYVSQNPHKYTTFDAVYLFTGLNLATYNGYTWELSLQGLAYVAGACSYQKVAIGEDSVGTFFGVRIFTHEVGHLLGCPHDGQFFGSYSSRNCPWDDGYIMSYRVENSRSMKFSPCCQENIWQFVQSESGRCVLEERTQRRIGKGNYTRTLPGDIITEEKICRSAFPQVSDTYLMQEGKQDCQGRCYMPQHSYHGRFRTAVFPDNYRCRSNMYCVNGDCVVKKLKYSIYRPSK
ncbi:hypothetical protein MRX96_056359 [Rhipicephalus microplus]